MASGLDINGCVLSYFECTANLLIYIVAKFNFFSVVTRKYIINIYKNLRGVLTSVRDCMYVVVRFVLASTTHKILKSSLHISSFWICSWPHLQSSLIDVTYSWTHNLHLAQLFSQLTYYEMWNIEAKWYFTFHLLKKTEMNYKNCQDISNIRLKCTTYEEREDMGQSLPLQILCDRWWSHTFTQQEVPWLSAGRHDGTLAGNNRPNEG